MGNRPRMTGRHGRHVIVTGGSSGIGRAFVRQVLSRGAAVSVLALDDGDLVATAAGRGIESGDPLGSALSRRGGGR